MTQLWIALCVRLMLSCVKFANRLSWTLGEMLRLLQLNLFERCPLVDLFRPAADPPPPSPPLELGFS